MSRFPVGLLKLLIVGGAVLAAVPVSAGVFERVNGPEDVLRIWKVREGKGGIFYGKIIDRTVVPVDLPDSGPVQVTQLRIQVIDQVSKLGEKREVLALFRGGDTYRTSAQPSDEETAIGVEGIFLLAENPYSSLFPDALWIAGLNSVFRVQRSATQRLVVIGKGVGMPVAANRYLDDFMQEHRIR
jgi:hypothetical protein